MCLFRSSLTLKCSLVNIIWYNLLVASKIINSPLYLECFNVAHYFKVEQNKLSKHQAFSLTYRHTDTPYFIAFYYIFQILYFFYKLKVCANAPSRKSSISVIFTTTCAHFVSWCHIFVISAIFQIFMLLLYCSLWFVNLDYNSFGAPHTTLIQNSKFNQ